MRTIIGVMGSGEHGDSELDGLAYRLGAAVAAEGWILLNGGRRAGVMDASAKGASEAGGIVVGILPDADMRQATPHLTVAIRTGMGDGRNSLNVLSSDVVIALRGGAGTLSEIALALKAGKPVIALDFDPGTGFTPWVARRQLLLAATIEDAIAATKAVLNANEVSA